MHSREWYRVLATARYLCLNIDPDRWFALRPGQQMLQTFHGYPAKSMGIRMWEGKGFLSRSRPSANAVPRRRFDRCFQSSQDRQPPSAP